MGAVAELSGFYGGVKTMQGIGFTVLKAWEIFWRVWEVHLWLRASGSLNNGLSFMDFAVFEGPSGCQRFS